MLIVKVVLPFNGYRVQIAISDGYDRQCMLSLKEAD